MEKLIDLLRELCLINAPSGEEYKVSARIKKEIESFADEVYEDYIGNLITFKKGTDSSKKLMVCAHMDEVGFIVKKITDDGYLKFEEVGEIDPRVILSKEVAVGDKRVKGVVGSAAIHLTKKDERKNAPQTDALYIDIGAKDSDEAKKHVSLGDYVSFESGFFVFGNSLISSKGLDDRAGCAVMCFLIKENMKYDTYFVFTSGEEIGLRGASAAANALLPDSALVLECTSCADFPNISAQEHVTKMGEGAAISLMDARTIYDKEVATELKKIADEKKIPIQYKKSTAGGNDSGAISLAGKGVKMACLSLPCRNLHAPNSIISIDDLKSMYELSKAYICEVK